MSYPIQQNPISHAWLLAQAGMARDGRLLPVALPSARSGHVGAVMLAQAESAKPGHAAQAGSIQPGMPQATPGTHEAPGITGHESNAYEMPEELPNVATWVEAAAHPHGKEKPSDVVHLGKLPIPIDPLFSIFYALLIVWVVRMAMRRASVEKPGKLQVFVEALMGGLRNFFVGIMGAVGEKYVPYLGSLWLFIWVNNLAGLVPGLKAPTSSFKITIALGLCTFFYVQFNAIKEGGVKGWLYHLLGSPTDAITWCLSPLFLFLEVIGELVKPVSLSLRLFGNIFGEDKLLASFLGMGMLIVAAIFQTAHPWVGVPLHVIFFPLVVLTSTIQATVFSLLSAIYIVLLLPHEDHEHEEHGATGPELSQPGDSKAAIEQV